MFTRSFLRGSAAALLVAIVVSGCSSLGDDEVSEGQTTATTVVSTTQTSMATTTSTTRATTTAPPTTVESTTIPDQDAQGGAGEGTLPRTGPTEATLFAAVGFGLLLAGRSMLDALGWMQRWGRGSPDPEKTLAPR